MNNYLTTLSRKDSGSGLLTRFQQELSQTGKADPTQNGQVALPPLAILQPPTPPTPDRESQKVAALIEKTFASFGVPAEVVDIQSGPRVTQFGIQPGFIEKKVRGELVKRRVKVSAIVSLKDDLSLALATPIRIAPARDKPYLGLEVPNATARPVHLSQVLRSPDFIAIELQGGLGLALGCDVFGAVAADLTEFSHLLIAGATGSGKSVLINTLIASLLFTHAPTELKFLMIDPKRVELTHFFGIPHLVQPVVTEVERAVGALTWAVGEMERRYELLEKARVRHISQYHPRLPYLVVVIDEMADLMMSASQEVEPLIQYRTPPRYYIYG